MPRQSTIPRQSSPVFCRLSRGTFRRPIRGCSSGETAGPVKQRIRRDQVDGDPDRVRQLWESSDDGGKSWTVAFDGLYVRKKE
jgi:hypothetical protein